MLWISGCWDDRYVVPVPDSHEFGTAAATAGLVRQIMECASIMPSNESLSPLQGRKGQACFNWHACNPGAQEIPSPTLLLLERSLSPFYRRFRSLGAVNSRVQGRMNRSPQKDRAIDWPIDEMGSQSIQSQSPFRRGAGSHTHHDVWILPYSRARSMPAEIVFQRSTFESQRGVSLGLAAVRLSFCGEVNQSQHC